MRSRIAVAGVDSYSLAVHDVSEAHTRSCVALGALISYCPAVQTVVGLQTRSLVSVGAADCHWSAPQFNQAAQWSAFDAAENVPAPHGAQVTSTTAEPALATN